MFDVLVIGGGHAGVEAACAAARCGVHTALLTQDRTKLAALSCNPAIGGTAKGQLAKEVDALGGVMAEATDRCAIQYRMLNRSKGPAVWSPRAQVDRALYPQAISRIVSRRFPELEIIEDEAVHVELSGGRVQAVVTAGGHRYLCRAAILCAGTFLRGLTHVGTAQKPEGRYGEPPSNHLSSFLAQSGFPLKRFKTGTPPRVYGDSVDFSVMERQESDEEIWFFSHRTRARHLPQLPCYRTHTAAPGHDLIRENIHLAPLFNGTIQSTGPRYCPSIEDKVMRFPDRERHPLVFEPEGLSDPLYYVNGFSSSLPEELQLKSLRVVPGCEQIRFARPAYAIEYDMVPPHELTMTLETRRIPGLYLAGQINGTSGYEEAAVQGIVAGANAAAGLLGREPFLPGREDAYTGVLIDDLVTLRPEEPYRMFTSRAEYRLLLRQDNAEERLHEAAFRAGLIGEERYEQIAARSRLQHSLKERLSTRHVQRGPYLPDAKNPEQHVPLSQLLQNPGVRLHDLLQKSRLGREFPELLSDKDLERAVEIELKYEGYLARERRRIAQLRDQEGRHIPGDFDFSTVPGFSAEGRAKLIQHRPATLGQASRIPGVTPTDVAILLVALKRRGEGRAGTKALSS